MMRRLLDALFAHRSARGDRNSQPDPPRHDVPKTVRDQIRQHVGPVQRWDVPDVEAAITLAREFQRTGTYDLFRGQGGMWPVHSGAVRLEIQSGKNHFDVFKRNLLAFQEWLAVTPGGDALATNLELIEAAMQHYCGEYHEFKTYLIDFTRDPQIAGYFATEAAGPGVTGESCIICLNSGIFEMVWERIADANPALPKTRIVRPDVPDLWRLQAQEGVFVRAMVPMDDVYQLDRIVFPIGTTRPQIPKSRIYPDRRSRLEDLIDHYARRMRSTAMTTEEIFDFLASIVPKFDKKKAQAEHKGHLSVWLTGFHQGAFRDGRLVDHPTWPAKRSGAWVELPNERFNRFAEVSVDFPGADSNAPADLARLEGMLRHAIGARDWRQTHVDFKIGGCDTDLSATLDRVWDGMRPLPYTFKQMVIAIFGVCSRSGPPLPADDETISIEMGSIDGQYTQIHCTRSGLTRALRPDIDDVLAEHRRGTDDVSTLLLWAFTPRKLFSFEPFVDLFAAEIVPAQALSDRKAATIFSPLSIHAFGRP